jgi:hypothetical protein
MACGDAAKDLGKIVEQIEIQFEPFQPRHGLDL